MYSHVSNVSLSSFPFPRHVNRAANVSHMFATRSTCRIYESPSHSHTHMARRQVGIALSSFPFDMSDNQNRMCVQCFQWDGKLFVHINSYSSRVVLAVCVLCAYHLTAIVAYIQRDFSIYFFVGVVVAG